MQVQDALTSTDGVVGLFPPQINDAGDAVIVSAIPERAPSSPATADLVRTLRSDVLPNATAGEGVVTNVGGSTASNVDLATKIGQRLPIVIATVVLLSFLLLMVAFHSVMVPLQAAVTNLLSVAAALGVLTAVFQWGWGLSLIGLDVPRGTVPIASYVPLMMFAVLFGLSMDYEVFFVSRVEQQHAAGKPPREAVPAGLGASARVISAAALIMFCVFASFVINGDPTVKQFGVGLAVAVLLAGTMVVLAGPCDARALRRVRLPAARLPRPGGATDRRRGRGHRPGRSRSAWVRGRIVSVCRVSEAGRAARPPRPARCASAR